MDTVYVPVLAALAGAVIGSLSSIGGIYLQARVAARADRMRQAVSLAIEDHKTALEVAKGYVGRTVSVPPMAAYVHYHSELLDALERGPLNEQVLQKIRDSNRIITEFAEKLTPQ